MSNNIIIEKFRGGSRGSRGRSSRGSRGSRGGSRGFRGFRGSGGQRGISVVSRGRSSPRGGSNESLKRGNNRSIRRGNNTRTSGGRDYRKRHYDRHGRRNYNRYTRPYRGGSYYDYPYYYDDLDYYNSSYIESPYGGEILVNTPQAYLSPPTSSLEDENDDTYDTSNSDVVEEENSKNESYYPANKSTNRYPLNLNVILVILMLLMFVYFINFR